jgi:predicted ABC-type ATPase
MSKNNSKQLWLLAGGNGAGKSTFYQQFLASTGLPFINADILAKELDPEQPEAISYKAAKLAENLRLDLLRTGVSFCFETVFSHPSKIDFLATAKSAGYEIILIYIHLQNDQLNQARVLQRVIEGGHSVPSEKIISRIPRTMQYVRDALSLVDVVQFYDNSSHKHPFTSIALIQDGALQIQQRPLPDWAEKMLVNYL